jgi:hypothetical protein
VREKNHALPTILLPSRDGLDGAATNALFWRTFSLLARENSLFRKISGNHADKSFELLANS